MDEMSWRSSRRRPHSAGGAMMETNSFSRSGSVEMRLPSRTESLDRELTSSPELDFTDKLKALRELIASSKGHRHVRQSTEKASSRIMARRSTQNLYEAQEVGEKLKFTANSFERRELAERSPRASSDKELIAREGVAGVLDETRPARATAGSRGRERFPAQDQVLDSELLLDAGSGKYHHPRPHSVAESYSHLLSRDLQQMGLALEEDWIASEKALAASSRRVTFRKEDLLESRRSQSSLGYYHHEVPERDWSSQTRTRHFYTESSQKGFGEGSEKVLRSCSADQGNENLPQSVSSMLSASDVKARELMREKELLYEQYPPKEIHTGTSPPEHDYPSSENAKPIQTNVQISDKLQKVRARPHSADLTRRVVSSEVKKHSVHKTSTEADNKIGHWTQLLSEKRDKNDSRSVPSSPMMVQSNVSLELTQHSSSHAFLLQETARQLEREAHQAATTSAGKHLREKMSHGQTGIAENGGDLSGLEEQLQDDEVANILQHPRAKKKIIIKRGSVRTVREANLQQMSEKNSAQQSSTKAGLHSQTKSRTRLEAELTQDSDDSSVFETKPVITKDEHIVTLDKLKSLLRGRRSESRPSSRASSASLSSPSPMKAFHHTKLSESHALSQNGKDPVAKEAELHTRQEIPKPVQRKVIKRPPSVPKTRENSQQKPHGKNSSLSQQSLRTDIADTVGRICSEDGAQSKGVIDNHKQKPARDRPSSAPQFSSRLSSSSLSGSVKSHSSLKNQEKNSTKKMSSMRDEKVDQRRRQSGSSVDFVNGSRDEGANTLSQAKSLRGSVQRLHQEISMRMNQDAYVVQDLMNKADGFDGDVDLLPNLEVVQDPEPGQIRRRLSFDENAAEKKEVSAELRSQSCIPFGKRLGAGMVDTGSSASETGSALSYGGLLHNVRDPPAVMTTSGRKQQQTNLNSKLDNDEDSFLTNVHRLSRDLATSTPKQAVHRKKGLSVLPTQDHDSRSSALNHHSQNTYMMPEKLLSDNLRQKRPASVGAIPFHPGKSDRMTEGVLNLLPWQSIEGGLSGGDAADMILSQLGNASMVHLLQQLYTADDATRQSIIVKAQYFKLWQTTAQSLKHQRKVYEESLQSAHRLLISRLRRRYFHRWRTSADESRKNRMAASIHRQHMLRKGLQGLRWAIKRSKHQTRTLIMKVSAIVLRTSFSKWQAHFELRREQRMRTALVRWREFAYEEKSVREMQHQQNEKLIYQTMLVWKEAYDRRVKENIADKYLRRTSLQQCWRSWCHFTLSSKGKAHRHALALDLRKRNMQRTTMHVWRVALHQSKRATQHFRRRRLCRTLQAWHHGAQISHVERQRDMATSIEHWRHTTIRHTFIRWHQQLHQCRATAMANKTLSRKTFDHWRQVWQTNTQRRQEVEAAITYSRLRKCLLTWRRNVIDRRRKQKRAIFLLESCLMRGTLLAWRNYTAYKTGFRASLQQHVRVIQRTALSRCFLVWRDALHQRLDERRRRELWSLSCVRKMTAHWRHKCHVRRLQTMFEETEPVRELELLRRMFGKWLTAKGRADEENAEVVASRHILERCNVQRRFQEWRLATQRGLLVKPLVLRRQRLLVTWCFDAWLEYIRNRLERRNCEKLFQKSQLSRAFTRWRRQYHCQQVSRLAQQNFMHRLALCLLQEWREILQRKHQAQLFHCRNLLLQSFQYWKSRTSVQLREKAEEQAEQEMSHELKRHYFHQWWSGVQAQMAYNSDAIASLRQRQNHNHIRSAFISWRRSLHAHLISRAYQQSATQRLLRSVLLEWHEAASQSLCSAVQHFAQQLGLQQDADDIGVEENAETSAGSLKFTDLLDLDDTDQFSSPCSSSTTSVKRLFASDHSANSERLFGGDLDLDRATLLNSGLMKAMEERRGKDLRLQELVMTFVSRLSHWPVSLAFSQWLDYTQRQRHLRQLAQDVEQKHRALAVAMAFRMWRTHLTNSQKATNMRNWRLQHGSLTALFEYSRHRKVKAALAEKARGHLVKHVLGRIFPWWLAKAQEQRHQRTILHLWTTATPEEAELLPLEASLSRQIRHRSLRLCLHVWRVRFLFLIKLKRVYHSQLLCRVMSAWQDWASLRQVQRRKGENFLQARRTNLAFKTWCERLHQKRETERRYQAALQGYMRLVFRCWRDWAHVSAQHKRSRQVLEGRVNLMTVRTHFFTWRRLEQHARTIRAAHHTYLLHSVFVGWHQATQDGKQLRQTILSFQAASLTRLVGQLFHRWQLHYHQRQRLHMLREERAQRSALLCGQKWRRKAQNTRGRKLIVVFKYSRLTRMFNHWRSSLGRVEELKQRQADYLVQKNKEVMRRLLHEWRQKLQSALVFRSFTHKLMVTVLDAWQVYAKASKERRIRGLALQHALQERNLQLYFLYWRRLSLRVRSLQNNVEVRLQLRVLKAWSYVVRRRCSQRRHGEKFAGLRQHRQLASSFMTMRSRFDYCQGLREIADSMNAKRDRNLAVHAMERWKTAVDNRLAQRFYERLLCVRTARTWICFVQRMKAERQHDAEQHSKAVTHHNKKICLVVLTALKQEVKVKHQLQRRRHRLAIKFASSWKRIADLTVTAIIVDEERLYARYWRCWRLAWVRRQAVSREAALNRRQILSQVFTLWRSLCPSHARLESQATAPNRHTSRVMSTESGRNSPTTPRSFLPVPVGASRRSPSEPNAY